MGEISDRFVGPKAEQYKGNAQWVRCVSGEHEAQTITVPDAGVPFLTSFLTFTHHDPPTKVSFCKFCRCLFVAKQP